MSEVAGNLIRAAYDDVSIRVYQAFGDEIADKALVNGTFVSPPFKMDRMTWIKPSFLWMMYRAGWGWKDEQQRRILAIDISRDGFEWALRNGCRTRPDDSMTAEEWAESKNTMPVRIQWDPDRDLYLQPLQHRTIQIGLGKVAVDLYVNFWIQRITDVTGVAHEIHALIENNHSDRARAMLPTERLYPFKFHSIYSVDRL